jgi:hypothetical protein
MRIWTLREFDEAVTALSSVHDKAGLCAMHFRSVDFCASRPGALLTRYRERTSKMCLYFPDIRFSREQCDFPDDHAMSGAYHLTHRGGVYGSGVPSLIAGYFLRLSSNSPTIFTTGSATQLLYAPTSRSSLRSVSRLMTFGNGSF